MGWDNGQLVHVLLDKVVQSNDTNDVHVTIDQEELVNLVPDHGRETFVNRFSGSRINKSSWMLGWTIFICCIAPL